MQLFKRSHLIILESSDSDDDDKAVKFLFNNQNKVKPINRMRRIATPYSNDSNDNSKNKCSVSVS